MISLSSSNHEWYMFSSGTISWCISNTKQKQINHTLFTRFLWCIHLTRHNHRRRNYYWLIWICYNSPWIVLCLLIILSKSRVHKKEGWQNCHQNHFIFHFKVGVNFLKGFYQIFRWLSTGVIDKDCLWPASYFIQI